MSQERTMLNKGLEESRRKRGGGRESPRVTKGVQKKKRERRGGGEEAEFPKVKVHNNGNGERGSDIMKSDHIRKRGRKKGKRERDE